MTTLFRSEDAEVDFAAEGFHLDAAVLREAALGDVHLRHEFQAADDGGLEFAGRGLLLLEDAVDAEADLDFFLEGFDVDVAGALLDGLGDHGVDEADDGGLAGHVAELLEFGGRFRVLAGERGGLAFLFAVVALKRVCDFGFGGDFGADTEPRGGAHGGEGFEVERIGHRQHQRSFVHAQGEDAGLAEEARRELFGFGGDQRGPVEPGDGQFELFGQRLRDVALRGEAEVHENAAELLAALALEFERALEVFGVQEALAGEDLAQPHRITLPGRARSAPERCAAGDRAPRPGAHPCAPASG